jgi:sulfur-carrier protein
MREILHSERGDRKLGHYIQLGIMKGYESDIIRDVSLMIYVERCGVVKIIYFARLREALGVDQEELSLSSAIGDVGALTGLLRERGGPWEKELSPGRSVRVAVNHEMANANTRISDRDEIAYFPPVTGG